MVWFDLGDSGVLVFGRSNATHVLQIYSHGHCEVAAFSDINKHYQGILFIAENFVMHFFSGKQSKDFEIPPQQTVEHSSYASNFPS